MTEGCNKTEDKGGNERNYPTVVGCSEENTNSPDKPPSFESSCALFASLLYDAMGGSRKRGSETHSAASQSAASYASQASDSTAIAVDLRKLDFLRLDDSRSEGLFSRSDGLSSDVEDPIDLLIRPEARPPRVLVRSRTSDSLSSESTDKGDLKLSMSSRDPREKSKDSDSLFGSKYTPPNEKGWTQTSKTPPPYRLSFLSAESLQESKSAPSTPPGSHRTKYKNSPSRSRTGSSSTAGSDDQEPQHKLMRHLRGIRQETKKRVPKGKETDIINANLVFSDCGRTKS